MKRIACAMTIAFALCVNIQASDNSKTWPASDKAKQFIRDNIVMDMFASPYGVGWTEPEQLHDYLNRAHAAGITGSSATLAPTYYTFEQFRKEHEIWRSTMLQTEDRYVFVKHVEDIERSTRRTTYWKTTPASR